MFDLKEKILDDFLRMNNQKIKEETLKEYLRSFKNDDLVRLALTDLFLKEDYGQLFKINMLANKPKKYLIDYILDNLESILPVYIRILKTNQIDSLKRLMDNNNQVYYIDDYNLNFSLGFLDFLKRFSLAKIEYNKKQRWFKIYMPQEFINILKASLEDKELLKENENNNEMCDYINSVLAAYGIISIDELYKLFQKQMYKIDEDEFISTVTCNSIFTEYYVFTYNKGTIVCNLEFGNEDDALYFYEEQKMNYKSFNKNDYKAIYDGTYVEKLKSYKKFQNYLCRHFIGISEALEFIKDSIVNDYIFSAQISKEIADKNFRNNIKHIIEADEEIIDELLTLVQSIYKEYPKWIKRGNV